MAYTEFCCRSGGSNMNAGSVDGGSSEPATSALVTYTGGDWDSATSIYTAPVAAVMTEAVVGRFMSIYVDGDTTPTANQYMVARITVVNAGTRQITVSTTARALRGTIVSTGTGTRSARIGGAWAGPSGTNLHPFWQTSSIDWSLLLGASSNKMRLNLKNDQTYTVSAAMTALAGSVYIFIQGYTSSYGDGGRVTISGGSTGASYILMTAASLVHFGYCTFTGNGATGSANLVNADDARVSCFQCVFTSCRGTGFVGGGNVIECEAYACNASNTSGKAGFEGGNIRTNYVRSISHDNTGSNNRGWYVTNAGAAWTNCIADTNGEAGFYAINSASFQMLNCDSYNNTGSGLVVSGANNVGVIQNCNFTKNGAWGIALPSLSPSYLINNRYGAGTEANASGTVQNGGNAMDIGNSSYASDVMPWTDPANGDFRISLAAAKGAGRGSFTQTAASYAGTVGYPDIGAAQHADSGSSGIPTARGMHGGMR